MTVAPELSAESVARAMQRVLTRPPAAVGKRLRSEQELADRLNVGRWRIRESISQLVDQGILVRRRGSGTYVRRIPPTVDAARDPLDDAPIESHMLFADDDTDRAMILQPTLRQRQLQLSLWTDWGVNIHATIQGILSSIVRRVQETGNHLSLHSLVERENVPLSPKVLTQRLTERAYDGYLVLNRWSKPFAEAMSVVRGAVLFFHHSTQVIAHPSLVTFDTEEATQRAMMLLTEEGYERIGVLGFQDPSEPEGFKEANYETFATRIGVKYRAAEFTIKSSSAIWEATRRMFDRADRPDALYVAHDHALATILDALRSLSLEPGRDLGLITLSNRVGISLPHGYEWSRLEFDAERLGIAVVDELLRMIQSADAPPMAQTFHATWRPGKTHLRSSSV